MKKTGLLVLLLLLLQRGYSQTYLPFEQVKKYLAVRGPDRFDSSLNGLTNRLGMQMHYLYPVYQALGFETRFKKLLGEKLFDQNFSQLLAFEGDYGMALRYDQKAYDTLSLQDRNMIRDTVSHLKNIQYVPAKEAIIKNAAFYQVVMINEAHNKPLHRAFVYTLLDDLYKQGYRYLAMEALNNYSNKCLDSVNVLTGYYATEPVMGELIRKALRLGFRLISYEDTLAGNHTLSERDSIQAANIYSVIRKDPSAKILVYAGYSHISESKLEQLQPMAWWFKKISGIDPFTVDQVSMTEGGMHEFGRLFYDYFNERFMIQTPSVIYQNMRPFNPLMEKGYDAIVMHPVTSYLQNRPSWLSFDGERKQILIQPTQKDLFFVQAFYASEYDSAVVNYLAPADQTYLANKDGYYCLFLRKGSYRIVLRSVSNAILATKELEVQ